MWRRSALFFPSVSFTLLFFFATLASQRLLRVGVCRLRQRASQPAPPDQVRPQVSPGRVLSQRCGPAASATVNEEISVAGAGGNALLMGGASPWKQMIDACFKDS